MSTQIWVFWGPVPPLQACPHLVDHPLPPTHADTRLALFETLQLVNNSHWRVKKLIILFENNIKNIWMKTIFEMMSLHSIHSLLNISRMKILYTDYCQIIWVNFTNMAAMIFFPGGHPHLDNHPLPCPHDVWWFMLRSATITLLV